MLHESSNLRQKQLNEDHGESPVQAVLEVTITTPRTLLESAIKKRKGESLTISALAVMSDGGYVSFRRIA
jgi:hypothetical protein